MTVSGGKVEQSTCPSSPLGNARGGRPVVVGANVVVLLDTAEDAFVDVVSVGFDMVVVTGITLVVVAIGEVVVGSDSFFSSIFLMSSLDVMSLSLASLITDSLRGMWILRES